MKRIYKFMGLVTCVAMAACTALSTELEMVSVHCSTADDLEGQMPYMAVRDRALEIELLEQALTSHRNWNDVRHTLMRMEPGTGWVAAVYGDLGEQNYEIRGYRYSTVLCTVDRYVAISDGQGSFDVERGVPVEQTCDIPAFWQNPLVEWETVTHDREITLSHEPTRLLIWGDEESRCGKAVDAGSLNDYYTAIFSGEDIQ